MQLCHSSVRGRVTVAWSTVRWYAARGLVPYVTIACVIHRLAPPYADHARRIQRPANRNHCGMHQNGERYKVWWGIRG